MNQQTPIEAAHIIELSCSDSPILGSVDTAKTNEFLVIGSTITRHSSNVLSNPNHCSPVRLRFSDTVHFAYAASKKEGRETYWHVRLKLFTISLIFSNRCLSSAPLPFLFSTSSISDSSESTGVPDLAITKNVSVSKATTSTPKQRSRRKVRCEVIRLIFGIKVCTIDDHAYIRISLRSYTIHKKGLTLYKLSSHILVG